MLSEISEGASMGETRLSGEDMGQARACVRGLARLHAHYWGGATPRSVQKAFPTTDNDAFKAGTTLLKGMIPSFLQECREKGVKMSKRCVFPSFVFLSFFIEDSGSCLFTFICFLSSNVY